MMLKSAQKNSKLQLKKLLMSKNDFSAAGVKSLASMLEKMGSEEEFDLSHSVKDNKNEEAIKPLFESLRKARGIRILKVNGNKLSSGGV